MTSCSFSPSAKRVRVLVDAMSLNESVGSQRMELANITGGGKCEVRISTGVGPSKSA